LRKRKENAARNNAFPAVRLHYACCIKRILTHCLAPSKEDLPCLRRLAILGKLCWKIANHKTGWGNNAEAPASFRKKEQENVLRTLPRKKKKDWYGTAGQPTVDVYQTKKKSAGVTKRVAEYFVTRKEGRP